MKARRFVIKLTTTPRRTLLLLFVSHLAGTALADDAAVYTGYMISEETPPEISLGESERAVLEGVADLGLSLALHHVGIDPGTEEFDRITGAVDEFFDSTRPQDRQIDSEDFVAVYLPCMMRMQTPTNSIAIRLPPGAALAYMEGWDRTTGEGFAMELNRDLSTTAGVTGEGWNSSIDMVPQGRTASLLGYEADEYAFESSGGLGSLGHATSDPQQAVSAPGQSPLGGIGAMVSVKSTGTTMVSDEVPGIDIVRAFYENFSRQIAASQGEGSFYGGLIRNLVGFLQHGLPLHTRQTTESKVAGRTMMSGTSESRINGAFVLPLEPDICAASTIPEGYEITQIAPGGFATTSDGSADDGTGSAAGSSGSAGTIEVCDCSCDAFERLQEEGQRRSNREPDATDQAMAMCAMQCTSEWMACAMRMAR